MRIKAVGCLRKCNLVAFVSRTCIKVHWHEALWSHLQSLEAVLAGGRGVFFALRTLRE